MLLKWRKGKDGNKCFWLTTRFINVEKKTQKHNLIIQPHSTILIKLFPILRKDTTTLKIIITIIIIIIIIIIITEPYIHMNR
jgi:hypothetical protein